MNPGHLPFILALPIYRPIETLLHLRNAETLTLVERKCFLEISRTGWTAAVLDCPVSGARLAIVGGMVSATVLTLMVIHAVK